MLTTIVLIIAMIGGPMGTDTVVTIPGFRTMSKCYEVGEMYKDRLSPIQQEYTIISCREIYL